MTDDEIQALPRILIISPVRLNKKTGGGVAMSGFFKNWPIGSLAQIYSSVTIKMDNSVCNNYFRLINIKIPKKLLPTLGQLPYFFELIRFIIFVFINIAFDRLLPSIRYSLTDDNSIERQRLSYSARLYAKVECTSINQVLNWIHEFHPEAIYCQVIDQPRAYWWLPFYLSEILNIPLITHIMDDWPARIEYKKSFQNRLYISKMMNRCLRTLFDHSRINLSISDSMSIAYKKRYMVDFQVFQHSIDENDWKNLSPLNAQRPNWIEILYVGKILPHLQLQSLRDVAQAVLNLNLKGKNIHLKFYGPSFLTGRHSEKLISPPNIDYGGFIPEDEYKQRLIEADILLIVTNFDEESIRYGRYSMPAKLPEYMASGSAILVYGPKIMPPVAYALQNGWGYVVSRRDIQLLEKSIMKLIYDPELRRRLGNRARDMAFKHHNAKHIRKQFEMMIREVVKTMEKK